MKRPGRPPADVLPFVCTWCADRFAVRADLDLHWKRNPDCAAQRFVSNQTQSKYNDRVVVAMNQCTHEQVTTIRGGWQCLACGFSMVKIAP